MAGSSRPSGTTMTRSNGRICRSALSTAWSTNSGRRCVGMTTAEDWVMYVNVARLTEWHTIAERLAFFRDHAGTNTRTGSPANGLTTLRAIRSFWEPSELPTPPHRPLDAYRTEYRHVLGWALAAAAAHRDAASYREALELARAVLPRRSDRLRASVPGSVRDRLRRARRLTSKRGDR